MKRKIFHLTDREIKHLEKETKKTGLKMAEVVRRILDKYFGDTN